MLYVFIFYFFYRTCIWHWTICSVLPTYFKLLKRSALPIFHDGSSPSQWYQTKIYPFSSQDCQVFKETKSKTKTVTKNINASVSDLNITFHSMDRLVHVGQNSWKNRHFFLIGSKLRQLFLISKNSFLFQQKMLFLFGKMTFLIFTSLRFFPT